MNFLDFKTKVRNLVFVQSEAENLLSAHDNMFQEALQEIQKWVPQERDWNVDVIPFCATNFKCGLTIVAAPRGKIKQVFTIANGDFCQPVYYRQRDSMVPEQWARNILFPPGKPNQDGLPALPLGFQVAEKSTDTKCGRAWTGIWSIRNRNINVAPWIQSNESLVIVWEGVKENWADTDLVPDGTEFRKVAKLYLAFAHERDFGQDPQLLSNAKSFYDMALADFIHSWKENTRRVPDESDTWERNRFPTEIQAGLVPAVTPINPVFACIGRYGANNADELAVANLVKSWGPAFIVACGGNSYNQNYLLDCGQYYGSFQSDGETQNRFFPAPGKEDWDFNGLDDYGAFFSPTNNGRYYDVCTGDAHIFVIDSDAREPDGNLMTSPQAIWLKTKLLLSTARWKIVVMSDSPYGANGQYSVPQTIGVPLEWPFKTWGADLVLSGGDAYYDRETISGLNYICNGIGGQALVTGQAHTPNVNIHGAVRLTSADTSLLIEMVGVDGVVYDSVTLAK